MKWLVVVGFIKWYCCFAFLFRGRNLFPHNRLSTVANPNRSPSPILTEAEIIKVLQTAHSKQRTHIFANQLTYFAGSEQPYTNVLQSVLCNLLTESFASMCDCRDIKNIIYSLNKFGFYCANNLGHKLTCDSLLSSLVSSGSCSLPSSDLPFILSDFACCQLKYANMVTDTKQKLMKKIELSAPLCIILRSLVKMGVDWTANVPEATQTALLANIVENSTTFDTQTRTSTVYLLGQLNLNINQASQQVVDVLFHNAATVLNVKSGDQYLSQQISNTVLGLANMQVTYNKMPEYLQVALWTAIENNLDAQGTANVIHRWPYVVYICFQISLLAVVTCTKQSGWFWCDVE